VAPRSRSLTPSSSPYYPPSASTSTSAPGPPASIFYLYLVYTLLIPRRSYRQLAKDLVYP